MKKTNAGKALVRKASGKSGKTTVKSRAKATAPHVRQKANRRTVDVTMWIDSDVVAYFKANWPDWKAKMNEALVKASKRRQRVA